jgi:hypothetical protein
LVEGATNENQRNVSRLGRSHLIRAPGAARPTIAIAKRYQAEGIGTARPTARLPELDAGRHSNVR